MCSGIIYFPTQNSLQNFGEYKINNKIIQYKFVNKKNRRDNSGVHALLLNLNIAKKVMKQVLFYNFTLFKLLYKFYNF